MKFANIVRGTVLVSLFSTAIYAEEMINVNFNNMDLNQFVKTISKITGKNILVNGKLNGKVEFIGNKKIKKSSLFALANSILENKGYALIDHGDFLTMEIF